MTAASPVNSGLQERIRGGLIFGAVVLGALYYGGMAFAFLMGMAAAASVYEWGRMVMTDRKYHIPLMALGICYIGLSTGIMTWLRTGTAHGLYNMLTLLLIVWASDISAYFTGRAIGGPKLAPKISPKKTWAGFIGSSVGAGLVAGLLASPIVLEQFGVETIGQLSVPSYALMGFILAMVGQAGDLSISLLKRRYGVKDTGTLIPGHGGVLDRIDALLLVALAFGLIMAALS
jgi:phosphatidate cytidylyltransferase